MSLQTKVTWGYTIEIDSTIQIVPWRLFSRPLPAESGRLDGVPLEFILTGKTLHHNFGPYSRKNNPHTQNVSNSCKWQQNFVHNFLYHGRPWHFVHNFLYYGRIFLTLTLLHTGVGINAIMTFNFVVCFHIHSKKFRHC